MSTFFHKKNTRRETFQQRKQNNTACALNEKRRRRTWWCICPQSMCKKCDAYRRVSFEIKFYTSQKNLECKIKGGRKVFLMAHWLGNEKIFFTPFFWKTEILRNKLNYRIEKIIIAHTVTLLTWRTDSNRLIICHCCSFIANTKSTEKSYYVHQVREAFRVSESSVYVC